MTTQTATNGGTLQGFVDDLNGAVRANPVAAGLIGAGVLWMFFGRSRLPGAAWSAANSMAGAVGAAAQATGSAVGDAVAGTGARVGAAARQAGDAISTGATQAATVVRDTVSAGYDALASAGEQAAGDVKDAGRAAGHAGFDLGPLQANLKRTLERQPLMLGVIGLGIGAAIASAFPATDLEREVMGEAGAAVKDKITDIATETTEFVSDRAKQVLSDVKQEAAAQGLTPDAAVAGLKGVAGKVKTVAGASRDAIKGRLS